MSTESIQPAPGRYATAMQRAVAYTCELGFTRRTGFEPGPAMVTPEFSEIMREWARLNLCPRNDNALAGMCMQITEDLVGFLAGAGIDAIYTLGWMSYGDHPVYEFGHSEIERWLSRGIPDRRKIDVHAWVTLPSAEIIDPSWLSTVGIVQNKRDLIGAVIVADPDQSTSHQYHPVTVDTSLLYRMGILSHPDSLVSPMQSAPTPGALTEFVHAGNAQS